MGTDKQEMDSLIKKYKEICAELNMDKTAADEALSSFNRIGNNYSLEGEKLHWLACALYVACRKGLTPTVGRNSYVEGNCVPLTSLLKLCNLSLVQFFIMMRKWADMANLSQDMRNKIDNLERNFNVTTIIFKKFRPIFLYVFKDPSSNTVKQSKNKKQKIKFSLSSNDIFTFCWTLFIQVKSNFNEISADLVNSYHLLIAAIDFCYNNLLFTDFAKEILNPDFPELPENFFEDDYAMPESSTCIISSLCAKFEGIQVDAKGIKEHWWKPHIKRLVEKKILKCRNIDQLIGFFDPTSFDFNLKSIQKTYETSVLSLGVFEETIFLQDENLDELNNTPINQTTPIIQSIKSIKSLAPCTPLSNRHYLNNRELLGAMTPVSNATQTVSRLQSLLLGYKDQPSTYLLNLFEKCTENPTNAIKKRITKLGEIFLSAYNNSNEDSINQLQNSQDFAKKRLQYAVTFYYKMLENIANREMKMIANGNISDALTSVLSNEMFHVSLFACSVEIVLFAYKSQKVFPWIIEILKDFNNLQFQACDFYKVIELIIRDEEGLSRDIVKHLTSLEERILESIAWKSDSNLWKKIQAQPTIPAFSQQTIENQQQPVKPNKAGPLGLFFRKVYYLAWVRLKDLCERLKITEDDFLRKIWTCFEHAIRQNVHLMKDRHLDQIIMCTIYAMCKVTKRSVTFHEIMDQYRYQPHYQSHVYRSILLGNNNSNGNNLQVALANVDYDQERGDIIMFYNQIFVTEMKKYILRFSDNNSPPLSPLPKRTPNPISPFTRKISLTHPVYVSPLKTTNLTISPTKKHSTYCFSISPANDLKAINQMVRTSNPSTYSTNNSFSDLLVNSNSVKKVSKRIFQDNDIELSPTKRFCPNVNLLTSKLENLNRELISEREDNK